MKFKRCLNKYVGFLIILILGGLLVGRAVFSANTMSASVVKGSGQQEERIWTSYMASGSTVLLTTASVTETCDPGWAFELLEMRFTLAETATASEAITVTLDSGLGSAYDHLLLSQDMNGLQSYTWLPSGDEERYFNEDDALYISFWNTNIITWALEIKYRRTK